MVVFGVGAGFFLGAVADAEVDPLVLAFDHRHTHPHFRLFALRVERFDVDELEQLEHVQAALAVLHDTAAIELTGLERQLPADDAFRDRPVAGDFHRSEVRERAGCRCEDHGRHLVD